MLENNKIIKIIYLLPEKGIHGGMTAITKMYYDAGVFKSSHVRHFNTSFQREGIFSRALEGIIMKLRFMYVLISFRPHVIHVMTSSYWGFYDKCMYCFVAGLFGIKSVLNAVGGEFAKFYEHSGISKFAVKFFIKAPNVVVIGSSFWYDYFLKHFGNRTKLVKIPNPVHSSFFYRGDTGYLRQETLRIIYVGNIIESKGILELVELIKALDLDRLNIQFDIVGDGDLLSWLRLELADLIDLKKIIIHGKVSDEEKRNLLINSDLFITLTHFEVIPIAILEAMSASLAIFSTKVGGIPDLVSDGKNGFLFSLEELNRIPDKLEQICREKSDYFNQMGEKSKQMIDDYYDIMSVKNAYETLYSELLAK